MAQFQLLMSVLTDSRFRLVRMKEIDYLLVLQDERISPLVHKNISSTTVGHFLHLFILHALINPLIVFLKRHTLGEASFELRENPQHV